MAYAYIVSRLKLAHHLLGLLLALNFGFLDRYHVEVVFQEQPSELALPSPCRQSSYVQGSYTQCDLELFHGLKKN
uniref:Putative secreted protein n=1 Tax=Ixodes ricinus TaxID=34613 RepID=A0A6B0U4Z0_IXORI